MADTHDNPEEIRTKVPTAEQDADEIRIRAGIERAQKTIDEELEEGPEDFKPGDPDYDGVTAMRDIFAFTVGREADLVPAELRGLIAKFADGFVRADLDMETHDAEWEREQAEHERRRKEDEDREAVLRTATSFAVKIERADGVTVRVGPYDYRFQAEQAMYYFLGCAQSTAGARDAAVTVLPYDEAEDHRPGLMPEYAWHLAELIQEEGADREPGDFPDLYARFAAHQGERASALWREACEILDAPVDAQV